MLMLVCVYIYMHILYYIYTHTHTWTDRNLRLTVQGGGFSRFSGLVSGRAVYGNLRALGGPRLSSVMSTTTDHPA